ncbi:MAG: hypothetical protein PGN23_17150 [Sphingomonas adhaesiva]|uniref:hypothetical protein n=1 Tax=Sphingomonas adhaesiva TaxID=28212 RepID=UPI002FF95B54
MMTMWSRTLVVAAALTAAATATAQDPVRDVGGGWTLSPSSDGKGCFVTRAFPPPRETVLQFGLDTDGSNRLTLLNANWSIRARERMKLDFRLSNAAFPRHDAIGIVAEGRRGFVTTFGTTFPRNLATSAFLHVRRGTVRVEELSLAGSGTAIAALRTCVERRRAAPPAVSRPGRAAGGIPLDPFAGKAESRK